MTESDEGYGRRVVRAWSMTIEGREPDRLRELGDELSACCQVRLGDTNLWVEVEKDHTVYGDECKFGGGKVLREGMGQVAPIPRIESACDLYS